MCEVTAPPYCSVDKYNAFIEYAEALDDSGDESTFYQQQQQQQQQQQSLTVDPFSDPYAHAYPHPYTTPSENYEQYAQQQYHPEPSFEPTSHYSNYSSSPTSDEFIPHPSQFPTVIPLPAQSPSPYPQNSSPQPPNQLSTIPAPSPLTEPPPAPSDTTPSLPPTEGSSEKHIIDSFHRPYEDGDGDAIFLGDGFEFDPLPIAPTVNPGNNFTSPAFHHVNRVSSICNYGSLITSLVLAICTAANQNCFVLNKEDRSRLQFLKDTVGLITDFVSQNTTSCDQYDLLLGILGDRMCEVYGMLKRIKNQTSSMTSNFDIFELKLRGHLDELKSMFPVGSPARTPLSSIITDEGAREAWIRNFGSEVLLVSFNAFLAMLEVEGVLSSKDSAKRDRFVLFLRYFVNFPSDDLVSAYKWSVLIRLFGPYDTFSITFSEIVARRGFLGLVNRIKAFEILTMGHKTRSLLIRMSRTEPQFLAFSYKNSEGKIGHQINKDRKTGQPIPVSEFLKTKFPHYTLVNKTVDVEQILGSADGGSLIDYASGATGYILSGSGL